MVTPSSTSTERHDALTVSAVAIVVYALAVLLHEGVGHGGACLLVHGVPLELTSMKFDCSLPVGATTPERIVAAGGTIATLTGGLLALALYQITKTPPLIRYGLWLFAAVNIMHGTGYFLFSGVGNVGDWADVINGAEPVWVWRGVLAALGFASYLWSTIFLFRQLDPFLGKARPRRYEHALRLAARPYLVGGALDLIAGVVYAGGLGLVLISAVAASFGGTSGLAWGPQMLRGARTPSSLLEEPVIIVPRSGTAIVLGAVAAAAFIWVLGRGIVFSPR